MALSQTDKDIHEINRTLHEIEQALKAQNVLLAKVIEKLGEPVVTTNKDDIEREKAWETYKSMPDTARCGIQ